MSAKVDKNIMLGSKRCELPELPSGCRWVLDGSTLYAQERRGLAFHGSTPDEIADTLHGIVAGMLSEDDLARMGPGVPSVPQETMSTEDPAMFVQDYDIDTPMERTRTDALVAIAQELHLMIRKRMEPPKWKLR